MPSKKFCFLKSKKRLAVHLVILFSVFTFFGCSSVSIPKVSPFGKEVNLTEKEVQKIVSRPLVSQNLLIADYSPFPKEKLSMPKEGEMSTYGFEVTKALQEAQQAYLDGDGVTALKAIDSELPTTDVPGLKWQLSFLKAQVLLMMGKGADAEEELVRSSQYEADFVGYDLNSRALMGEVKVWLEDFDGAMKDFAAVIKAIGSWELPISYMSFPTNREQLYMLTTAKLRSYTGLAAVYIFKEDYQKAYLWAQESERLFNNAHFVTNHPLYGSGDSVHADNYYGRAMNLTFFASAAMAVSKDPSEAPALFEKAEAFYNALGYEAGKVTIAALNARIYNRLGKYDLCYDAGQKAMKLAVEKGLPDYIWRIGILSGKTLLALGKQDKAEEAFRQAQASVDLISGGLTTDRSKTRFGVGKEDITYHLAQIDIAKKDWNTLFEDLEKGRARSFVDLLSDRPEFKDREPKLMGDIEELEEAIRLVRLQNMAPGKSKPELIKTEKKLLTRHDRKIAILKSKDPELAELVSISTTSLSIVQSRLKTGEMIAYFIPGKDKDRVQILKIRNFDVQLSELSITHQDLRRMIHDFSVAFFDEEAAENRGVLLKAKPMNVDLVLTPKESIDQLKKHLGLNRWNVRGRLYVVPTGALHFMPWGVHETDYPISVLPNGSWVNRKNQKLNPANAITIVGDPEFGGDLPQLSGARAEAKEIGALFGQPALTGSEATEKALRQNVGSSVEIVHLATHGIFDPYRPLRSALYLTKDNKSYPLTAKRLFENPIQAKLVVLSACETGLGLTIAGDDLLGLNRSFYLGGTSTVLSSLWEIEDEGTKVFMLKFYEAVKEGDIGQAWLKARNYTKAKGYPASVYGAFNLGGLL